MLANCPSAVMSVSPLEDLPNREPGLSQVIWYAALGMEKFGQGTASRNPANAVTECHVNRQPRFAVRQAIEPSL